MEADSFLTERIESLGGNASFWPDTCFVEVDTEKVLDRSWEQTPEDIIAVSGLFHEHIHWTQLHGSTFGVFTFLLRHRRAELIECFLRLLSVEGRAMAFQGWERGTPLWRFAPGEQAAAERSSGASLRLSSHWNALLVFDQVFRRSDIRFSTQFNLQELFKVAYLHTDGRYSIEEIVQSDEPFFDAVLRRQTEPAAETALCRTPLSCRALEECAAFLNQREFYSNSDALWEDDKKRSPMNERLSALHAKRWVTHLDDPSQIYSSCIIYFLSKHSNLDLNDDAVLSTLLTIIDIALNPPLPPFADLQNRFPRNSNNLLSESDLIQLHPVLRFLRLVEALKEVGLPTHGSAFWQNSAIYRSYVGRLCKASGFLHPLLYLRQGPIFDVQGAIWRTIEDSPLQYLKAHVLRHHLSAVRVRKHRPGAFASPAHNLPYEPGFRRYLSRNKLTSVFLDPLQIISGKGYFAGVPQEEYWRILASASFSHALSSLLSARGHFFKEGLPKDDLHSGMVVKMQDYLVERLRS